VLGINEIFSGVALNAIANIVTLFMISGPWQPSEGGSIHSTAPFADYAVLEPLSRQFNVNLFMLIVTICAIVGSVLVLKHTHWGLRLRAVGINPRSARMLGVNINSTVLSAFLVCGAFAGMAGSYRALFSYQSLRPMISSGLGFTGLLVVLLVSNRATIVPIVSFLFSVAIAGSVRMRISMRLDDSLSRLIIDIVVIVVLVTFAAWERMNHERISS